MQISRARFWLFGLSTMGASLAAIGSLVVTAQSDYAAVKVECGPGSRPEAGLEGLQTAAERFSAPQSYTCNAELVGQALTGSSWGGAVVDTCVYLSRTIDPPTGYAGPPPAKGSGTAVVDAADSRNPKILEYMASQTMLEPNESLAASASRKLLAGINPYFVYDDVRTANLSDSNFEIYDVANCRKPVLKGTLTLPHVRSHGGYFAPDGRTFYLTSFTGNIPSTDRTPSNNKWRVGSKTDALVAIDVSDPAHPRELLRWMVPTDVGAAHHLSISVDGNRAYLNLFGRQLGSSVPDASGIAVVDISALQARKPNPQVSVLGRRVWTDAGPLQGSVEVLVKGRPYVFASTTGQGGNTYQVPGTRGKCPSDTTTFGYISVLDLRDVRNPTRAARIMLESSLPANCEKVTSDPVATAGQPGFCAVDDQHDAKVLACGYGSAGLRVFDIRNPLQPREVADDEPPSSTGPSRPGSHFRRSAPRSGPGVHADSTVRALAVRRDRGEIWFMSHENGFQVVKVTDWMKTRNPGLF